MFPQSCAVTDWALKCKTNEKIRTAQGKKCKAKVHISKQRPLSWLRSWVPQVRWQAQRIAQKNSVCVNPSLTKSSLDKVEWPSWPSPWSIHSCYYAGCSPCSSLLRVDLAFQAEAEAALRETHEAQTMPEVLLNTRLKSQVCIVTDLMLCGAELSGVLSGHRLYKRESQQARILRCRIRGMPFNAIYDISILIWYYSILLCLLLLL